MLKPSDYFDLSTTAHAALFGNSTYVWEALTQIREYIMERLSTDMPPNGHQLDVHPSVVIGDNVHVGAGTTIAPGVYIEGPALIGANCQIRHGAYVRADTVLGDGGGIGHATETKNSVMLEGAAAPHFAYVGDSLLGQRVNLGAGTKLSNFPMNADKDPVTGKRPTIHLDYEGERIDTGIVKIGAILGDGVNTGCNVVTNPGVLVGPGTMVYTLAMLRKGIYPANSIIKLRQTQEIVELRG